MEIEEKKQKAVELVRITRDPDTSDEKLGEAFWDLKDLIPHPSWGKLTASDATDEEVVEEALRYRPIEL